MVIELSALFALFLSSLFAFGFVLSLYIWRNPLTLDRDNPTIIKQRFISILTVSIAVPIIFSALSKPDQTKLYGPNFLAWLGFPLSLSIFPALILPLILTAILFTGPLLMHFLSLDSNNSSSTLYNTITESLHNSSEQQRLITMRNLLVAPLCEEFVFRICICTLLIAGNYSFNQTILISPILFGIAHLHHLINLVQSKGYSMQQGLFTVTFQLLYTSIFGCYASFIYLRTGHCMSVFLVHSFCNLMGFPTFDWLFSSYHPAYKYRTIILAAFMSGIIGFSYALFPLTDPHIYDSWIIHIINQNAAIHTANNNASIDQSTSIHIAN
jgi:prenyl protein peptidase